MCIDTKGNDSLFERTRRRIRFGFWIFRSLLWFVVLHDVPGGNKRLFEQAMNLAQFPEDQKKENRDHEQQGLDVHLLAL